MNAEIYYGTLRVCLACDFWDHAGSRLLFNHNHNCLTPKTPEPEQGWWILSPTDSALPRGPYETEAEARLDLKGGET